MYCVSEGKLIPMKFEYKQIRAQAGIKLGKRPDDEVNPKDVPEMLNELGAEGWELVNFAVNTLESATIYIFKRHIV